MPGLSLQWMRRRALARPGAAEAPHHPLGPPGLSGRIFATVDLDSRQLRVLVDEDQRQPAPARDPGFVDWLPWGGQAALAACDAGDGRPGG